MILLVKYKSGESRKVNLTEEFFKSQDSSVLRRAQDFAYMHGSDPYQILVFRGNESMVEHNIRANNPDEFVKSPWMVVDETKVKKQLRKQFKNIPFTQKYILHG